MATPQPEAYYRFNPFIFPSSTDFRFVLLIAAVLCSSLFIYSWLFNSLPSSLQAYKDAAQKCLKMKELSPDKTFGERLEQTSSCFAVIYQRQALWVLGCLSTLFLAGAILYWFYPYWIIYRLKLQPFTKNDSPQVLEHLYILCREAGLNEPPIFLWDPLNQTTTGKAFGCYRKYYVAITGGLFIKFYTDRAVFRAIIFHELAHLHNADVNKTYFAISIWWAFLALSIVPFALSLHKSSLDYIFSVGSRVAVLALLVFTTRNAVLRSREVYADVRASIWDGNIGGLRQVLAATPSAGWKEIWQTHPCPKKRLQALDDTRPLFRLSYLDAFLASLVGGLGLSSLEHFLGFVFSGTKYYMLTPIGAALAFVPLVIGIVGGEIWRETFLGILLGQSSEKAFKLSLVLGTGFIIGERFSLTGALGTTNSFSENGLIIASSITLDRTLRWIILTAIIFLFLRWLAISARAWLGVSLFSGPPVRAYYIGLGVAGIALTFLIGYSNLSNDTMGIFFIQIIFPFLLAMPVIALQHPITLLVLISIWAYPLAARLWQNNKAIQISPKWAFLDADAPALALPLRPAFHLRYAFWMGLIGGLFFALLILIWRLMLREYLPESVRVSAEFKINFFYGHLFIGAVLQALVAGFVTVKVKSLGTIHGLFAASIAGCFMGAATLILNLIFTGLIDVGFARLIFYVTINAGAMLAIPVAMLANLITKGYRKYIEERTNKSSLKSDR